MHVLTQSISGSAWFSSQIHSNVNPLHESENYGIDVYVSTSYWVFTFFRIYEIDTVVVEIRIVHV